HDSKVTALVISSDGQWVATASSDATIILWDARDASISQEWFAHHKQVLSLTFSPDCRRLASTGRDWKMNMWGISRSAHQLAALKGDTALSSGCAWSSNGAYIASRDEYNTIQLWDRRTFQQLPLDGPKTSWLEPLFSPDSRWLLRHVDDDVRLWDVVSGTYLPLRLVRRLGYDRDDAPHKAAFSPSSTHLAVGYSNGVVRAWDIRGNGSDKLGAVKTRIRSD
ncbi:hypothetical protein DICSQDRAFT_69691, partial [Dichomitus squalens LYAD-421 SS1]